MRSRFRLEGGPAIEHMFVRTEAPTKRIVQDVFLLRDLYPGVRPQLSIHDTMTRGVVEVFDDPARRRDRFRMHEAITALPGGLRHTQLRGVPRYGEMLEHVCQKLGWDPNEFRGYRLEVEYPVSGAQ